MELDTIIEKRRAYRSLASVEITSDIIERLAKAASLSCSCYNNQPWRYIFVHEEDALDAVKETLPKGNAWAKKASLITAVFSRPEYDCQIKGRDYFLFDTGMASAYMILKGTEMGLVMHPIAGFDEAKAKAALGIPEEMKLITLIISGAHANTIPEDFKDFQVQSEKERPARLPNEAFFAENKFNDSLMKEEE